MSELHKSNTTMTSPIANSNREAEIHKNNNNSSQSSSPSSNAVPKARRIINKIPLDFNKLKQAGLDRSIAEALGAKKFSEKSAAIASDKNSNNNATTTQYTAVPVPAATAQTQQNQKAPRKYTKTSVASNFISKIKFNTDSQVKQLLKAKILSKATQKMQQDLLEQTQLDEQQGLGRLQQLQQQLQQQVQQQQQQQQQQKQKLQQQQEEILKQKLQQQQQKHESCAKNMANATQTSIAAATSAEIIRSAPPLTFTVPIPKADVSPTRRYSKPLLLNSVNQLPSARGRCPPGKPAAKQETPPLAPLIVLEHKVLAPNEKLDLSELRLHNSSPVTKPIASTPSSATNNAAITSSATKLTATTSPTTKAAATTSQTTKQAAKGAQPKKLILNADKLKVSREALREIAKEIGHKSKEADLLLKPQFARQQSTTSESLSPEKTTLAKYSQPKKAASKIVKCVELESFSPTAMPATGEVFSAVDFIAQLAAENPMSAEESFLGLSAEELSMSASFGLMSFPGNEKKVENKPRADLAIGKIVKMDDMNILNATMDVSADGSAKNVLCISPNAVQLQDSSEGLPLVKRTETHIKLSTPLAVTNSPVHLADQLTTVAPDVQHKQEASTVVMTVESAKRVPQRTKKGKVNLVQRNKKSNVTLINSSNQVNSIEAQSVKAYEAANEYEEAGGTVLPKGTHSDKAKEAARNESVKSIEADGTVVPMEEDELVLGDKAYAAANSEQLKSAKTVEADVPIKLNRIVLGHKGYKGGKIEEEPVVPLELQVKKTVRNEHEKFTVAEESVVPMELEAIALDVREKEVANHEETEGTELKRIELEHKGNEAGKNEVESIEEKEIEVGNYEEVMSIESVEPVVPMGLKANKVKKTARNEEEKLINAEESVVPMELEETTLGAREKEAAKNEETKGTDVTGREGNKAGKNDEVESIEAKIIEVSIELNRTALGHKGNKVGKNEEIKPIASDETVVSLDGNKRKKSAKNKKMKLTKAEEVDVPIELNKTESEHKGNKRRKNKQLKSIESVEAVETVIGKKLKKAAKSKHAKSTKSDKTAGPKELEEIVLADKAMEAAKHKQVKSIKATGTLELNRIVLGNNANEAFTDSPVNSVNENLQELRPLHEQAKVSEEARAVSVENVIIDATEAVVNETQPEKLGSSNQDLTQPYPAQMPRYKSKRQHYGINDKHISDVAEAAAGSGVCLKDAVEQQAVRMQGSAQLPFRIKETARECSVAAPLGIKSLLNQLEQNRMSNVTAMAVESSDNVAKNETSVIPTVPQQLDHDVVIAAAHQLPDRETEKTVSVVSPAQKEPVNDAAKPPRKRLVKTRPVLAKRITLNTTKKVNSVNQQPVEKASSPAAATSDDDAADFHGFEDSLSQPAVSIGSKSQSSNIKPSETDISDDATPDEDEAEPVAQAVDLLNDTKTDTQLMQVANVVAVVSQQLENSTQQPEQLMAEPEQTNTPSPSPAEVAVPLAINPDIQTPTLVKAKRGRPPGSHNKKSAALKLEPSEELPAKRARKHTRTPTPPCETPMPKKRGRKPKNADTSTTNAEQAAETAEPQRRGRKRLLPTTTCELDKTAVEMPAADASDDDTPLFVSHTPRGRFGRRAANDTSMEQNKTETETRQPETGDFNIRLLLIRKREQLDTDEELREGVANEGSGNYQCGLCLVRSSKSNWMKHLAQHYGIGWLAEQTPPLLTRMSVINMMTCYLKNPGANKHFDCRLCERKLSSGLGMLLHLENCGVKQQRMECEFCKRLYTKLSLVSHLRSCPARFKAHSDEEQSDEAPDAEAGQVTEQYSNTGRTKRKSTIKAETKLKKIGERSDKLGDNADFDPDSSDYDEKKDKESSDEYESEGVDSNEDAIRSDDDEDQLSSGTRSRSIKLRTNAGKRVAANGAELPKQLYGRYREPQVVVAQRWKEFMQLNYTTKMLYEQLLPVYHILSAAEAKKCLPPADSKSMHVGFDNNKDWTQLARLEGFNTQTEHYTYLGAPIKQTAWVPLPATTDKTQYLLCSLRPKLLAYTRQFNVQQEPALLLLLKCTKAVQPSDQAWTLQTSLHYGVRIAQGPVHSFVFLPSGGYDAAANRLALLAIGSVPSVIKIYALPLQLQQPTEGAAELPVIEPQPLMLLSLDMHNDMFDHCVKICWSESAGHNFIAAGFASGHIAFWDIGDVESLNCMVREHTITFVPLHWFYLGGRNIRFMELHYDTQGPRWLAAASFSQRLAVYDISNWTQPVLLTHSRLSLSSMCWPSIWETIIIGYSNVFSNPFPRVIGVNPTGIYFTSKTIDCVLNSARAIHYSPQQNVQVIGTDNGDVVFLNSRELYMEAMIEKSASTYRAVSTIEVHNMSGDDKPADQTVSTTEFLNNYALLFNSLSKVPKDKKSSYLTKQRKPRNEFLTLLSNTTVHCNTNAGSACWVAVGTEHGILRIINFKREKYF